MKRRSLTVLFAGMLLWPAVLAAQLQGPGDICSQCRSLEEEYSAKNNYEGLAVALQEMLNKEKSAAGCVNYYLARARLRQLKYLEETQGWDEYFSRGNDYRQQLIANAEKAIEKSSPADQYHLYAKILLWEFYKGMQDVFAEEALSDLMNAAAEYAKAAEDTQAVKAAADSLYALDEKIKARQLYKIYADKIVNSRANADALLKIASGFYADGNAELSEVLYDAYIQRISGSFTREKLVSALGDIAALFVYKDEGLSDPDYAEKIFVRIEKTAGKDALTQELEYLRAFNLEKGKDFEAALKAYQHLLKRFPGFPGARAVIYKIGLISAYCLGDLKTARDHLLRLTGQQEIDSNKISAFYHLGLFKQWEERLDEARKYYSRLVEDSGQLYPETASLAKKRLQEIESGLPIEYSLKSFMDAVLSESKVYHDKGRLFLKSNPSRAKAGVEIAVESSAYSVQTGCLPVELQYLWSGNTGSSSPAAQEPSFKTTYSGKGIKEVFVTVVSPTEFVDCDVLFLEITD